MDIEALEDMSSRDLFAEYNAMKDIISAIVANGSKPTPTTEEYFCALEDYAMAAGLL